MIKHHIAQSSLTYNRPILKILRIYFMIIQNILQPVILIYYNYLSTCNSALYYDLSVRNKKDHIPRSIIYLLTSYILDKDERFVSLYGTWTISILYVLSCNYIARLMRNKWEAFLGIKNSFLSSGKWKQFTINCPMVDYRVSIFRLSYPMF